MDLSGAVPPPENCEPATTSSTAFMDMRLPAVIFLFKFVEINSGCISYKWTVSEICINRAYLHSTGACKPPTVANEFVNIDTNSQETNIIFWK